MESLVQGLILPRRYQFALNLSVIIRRLGVTIVLAIIIASPGVLVGEDFAAFLFLLSWVALFFGWPYLSRRLGFNFPKPPVPRQPPRTDWRRILITGAVAFVLAFGPAFIDACLFGLFYPLFWFALYYACPFLSRRLTILSFLQAPPMAPKRPLWLRLIRGTFAWAGGVVLALVFMLSAPMAPLVLSHYRAQKVHDSIHIGMTVPEVLRAAADCDLFQASSDFPYDEKAESDNIPAVSLGRPKAGMFRTYDLRTGQELYMSESETVARLHEKLHDGYEWRFRYTYINMTPQHISFSVVFGPDGRVEEVKPVYGWD